MVLVGALALGAGCGPSFAGTFVGTVTTAINCGGDAAPPSFATSTMVISESGDTAMWTPKCGPMGTATVTAQIHGDVANANPVTCGPAMIGPGFTTTTTVTGGTLTLHGDSLALQATAREAQRRSPTRICTATRTKAGWRPL